MAQAYKLHKFKLNKPIHRQVVDTFRDVQATKSWQRKIKNELTYANDVIPRARGEAEQVLQQAEAYKKVVAKAEGEASRFLVIYNEYKNAKQVTQERMYLETMEKVLADIDKVIIDKSQVQAWFLICLYQS